MSKDAKQLLFIWGLVAVTGLGIYIAYRHWMDAAPVNQREVINAQN